MKGVCYVLVVWGVLLLALPFTYPETPDIDGGWSVWSVLDSGCSKECDGGISENVRSCNNPTPQGNGTQCLREDNTRTDKDDSMEFKSFACNTHSCWENEWSDWSNCSEKCGKGKKTRHSLCGINSTRCEFDEYKEEEEDCNTWNRTTCPSPCDSKTCPDMAVCRDDSTDKKPVATCVCTMGRIMNSGSTACILPPPTSPTPRPIPTLPPEQKVVATVISKTASTILIICVSICIVIFLLLRIFTQDRVIQMNMEIALGLAHGTLMVPDGYKYPDLCRVLSIFTHFFFTACFMFMFLEALHMFGYVAYVVKKDGMCSRIQNTLVGWGVAIIIVLFCICFEYDNYGGEYHCWLRVDTPLFYGQLIPILALVILIFTLIEAAASVDYKPLKGIDKSQRTSAKFSQRTNLAVMPLVFSHMMVGIYSEYEQNLPLYGIFTILNSVTGVMVLFLHCFNNQQVRLRMIGMYKSMCKGPGGR